MNNVGVSQASNVAVYTTNSLFGRGLVGLDSSTSYELFKIGGRDNGHALDDWIQRAREIMHHLGL